MLSTNDAPLCSLAPVVAPDTRLLILGSLPGSVSLAARQYYAHPRNHFWRIIGHLLDCDDFAMAPYPERLTVLKEHAIGLWDVVGSASRQGSLDQNLKNITPNRLAELVDTLPLLKAIAFNGQTAARLGKRQLAAAHRAQYITCYEMPSTSPAHTMPFEEKLERWVRLKNELKTD